MHTYIFTHTHTHTHTHAHIYIYMHVYQMFLYIYLTEYLFNSLEDIFIKFLGTFCNINPVQLNTSGFLCITFSYQL